MDSRFDPLFRILPRLAEKADTRQDIRRQEEQDGRKKGGGGRDDEDESGQGEDSAVVSVQALKVFLETMVAASSAPDKVQAAAPSADLPPGGGEAGTVPPLSRSAAARAARAYGRGAGQDHRPVAVTEGQPPLPALNLTTEETEIIAALADDLAFLEKAGVEALHIRPGDGFLRSLAAAAAAAKLKLS